MVKTSGNLRKIIIFIVLCLISVSIIYPFVFMIMNSFKPQGDYFLGPLKPPKKLIVKNYIIMFKSYKILKLFFNSLIIVTTAIFFEIILSSLAAYAFAKKNFSGKTILFVFFISLMIIPFQVLMLPLYIFFAKIHLINTRIALIIIYTAVVIPFALYFLTVSFRTIPDEILEAAKLDGASYFRIYWSIILPIEKSVILTLFILDYVWLWNELILAIIFLQSDEIKTMTAGVATILGRYMNNQPLLLTGLLLSAIPTIIIYTIASRFLVKGMTLGAVKG